MPRRLLALCIGALVLVPAASAEAAPADVTFRAEGLDQTLVPRTAVRTTTATINKSGVAGQDCSGTSALGALNVATGGDWAGRFFTGLGYSVERIRAESHAFPDPSFFELWINNRSSSVGACGAELQTADEVLFLTARCDADASFNCTNAPVLPLGLTAPRRVQPGVPFQVQVVEFSAAGQRSPVAGATVVGGDTQVTTDAAGLAAVTAGAPGERTLQATKAGRVRTAQEPVCATSGSDGACGAATPPAACATSGRDGRCGTRDRTAAGATIRGIREGQRFKAGSGPRRLQAHVDDDPSGLFAVKLRLTRTDGRSCTYLSGKRERFLANRGRRCGASRGFWFRVGDRQDVDYLLPAKLPRGRYVLDVNAIDKAYNRDDARRRGANRIVFRVG